MAEDTGPAATAEPDTATLLDTRIDEPSMTAGDVEMLLSPSLRRVLVDLYDEYARHVGHADLFREAVDGLVGEDPPQPS